MSAAAASVADYLRAVHHGLPAPSPASAVADILRHTGALPAAACTYFGLECRPDGRTDIQLAILHGSPGHHLLAGSGEAPALPDAWRAQPAWQDVQAFARRWLRMPQIPLIFLALETLPDAPAVPQPFLHARTEKRNAAEILEVVAAFAERPGGPGSALAACLAAATPTFVGRRPRGPQLLRLTQPLPVAQVPAYLARIGFPGDREAAARLLAVAARWTGDVGLSLDIAEDRVAPYLGIEFLNWSKPVSPPPAWHGALAWLVDEGLLPAPQRDRLLAWPRLLHGADPHWPPALPQRRPGEPTLGTLVCRLHHIKLVLAEGGAPSAKVYVDACYRQVSLAAPGAHA